VNERKTRPPCYPWTSKTQEDVGCSEIPMDLTRTEKALQLSKSWLRDRIRGR